MARMPLGERRRRLIEAAIEVIGEKGVSGATTRAIAAKAEMPLASFHYAFDSHSALMGQVMRALLEAAVKGFDVNEVQGTTIADTVAAGLHYYIDSLVRDSLNQQITMELTHYCLRAPGHRHLATEQQAVARMVATRLFREFSDAHQVRWSVSIEQLATQMIIITDGITMSYIIDHDEAMLRAIVPNVCHTFDGYILTQSGQTQVR